MGRAAKAELPASPRLAPLADPSLLRPSATKKRSLELGNDENEPLSPPKEKKANLAPDENEAEPSISADKFREKFQITSMSKEQELPEPVQSFDEAPFSKKVRAALKAAGFAAPSPIQAQSWPIAVGGNDLVAVAQTGSGKTLAYLLPSFKTVVKTEKAEGSQEPGALSQPMVLVLAPTRELATQIEAETIKFGACTNVRSVVVFGGAPKHEQVKALKKTNPQVLVATPGRLQDLMESGSVQLGRVRVAVLDEADRMLDMGFEPEIAKIFATMPDERQTLLLTATWPKAVQKIARKYLKSDHVHVNVGETELAANSAVSQEFFKLGDEEKEDKTWRILDGLGDDAKVIVFTNTKRRVDALAKAFKGRGYLVSSLHGDKPQWERDRDLADFAEGRSWLLFATDVCARGIDIKSVTHVINYDMARDVEAYVHRIGRTGRAGAKGASITFWNEAYDQECAPALAKIAKEAGQDVPAWLEKAATVQKQVKNKGWRY